MNRLPYWLFLCEIMFEFVDIIVIDAEEREKRKKRGVRPG
jgi:hypothetical protein